MTLKRIISGEQNLALIQDNVDEALKPLQLSALTGGNLLTSIAVGTGNTQIPHKLGHAPTLWLVVRLDSNATVWEVASDDKLLTLRASSACTVSLWVK